MAAQKPLALLHLPLEWLRFVARQPGCRIPEQGLILSVFPLVRRSANCSLSYLPPTTRVSLWFPYHLAPCYSASSTTLPTLAAFCAAARRPLPIWGYEQVKRQRYA